jgi:hypothetical protein
MSDTLFTDRREYPHQNRVFTISVTPDGTPVLSIATLTGGYRDMCIYGDDALLIWTSATSEAAEFARQRMTGPEIGPMESEAA